jgi:OOP family OmpA-OmpF porin
MSNTYQGDVAGTKLDAEKDLLNKFNKTIPTISLNSGLRSFGFGPCLSWSSSVLNQPLQKYSQAGFNDAITSLSCSSGGTPLADALSTTAQDISAAPGNIALIVFSDGKDDSSPVPAAAELKTQHGDKLCIYTVWVGNENDTIGQANLSQIASASSCGFATTAANISSPAGMNEFVKNVFLKAGTPAAAPSLDNDQDGVIDQKDKCLDSPKGAIVDKDGCWAFHGVLFDFDSDKIKSTNDPLIANAVLVLKQNPQLSIEIQGHTDSHGKDAYNQKLSERRALAVKNELIRQGVASSRLSTSGFGESTPVDSNETDAGRAYNRRVAYKIVK